MRRLKMSLAAVLLLAVLTVGAFTVFARSAHAGPVASASVPSACYHWPVLDYGDTDSDHPKYVSYLQFTLNQDYQYGWFPNSPYNFSPLLKEDGIFGSHTLAAVKDIQTKNKVQVDGIVGPITWNLVNPGCGLG